ncbi:uncharacterized protein G2W53_040218 [Senna tora]|uniref:Uncharacterized protein n=1 Tax=Senna tora TaxID=362788 RepID=A0A834W3E1_9FABA|nr:uncharacterized protein G2W53_040218 [Senna tora]
MGWTKLCPHPKRVGLKRRLSPTLEGLRANP